jgi:hypothetical protein
MDAALSVILPPVGFLCKAKPLLLQIGGSSLMGVARSVQNSLIFPLSGRTSPLVFARTTTERLTPVRDQAAAAVPRSAAGCQRINAVR